MSEFGVFASRTKLIQLLLRKKLFCPECLGTNVDILEYGYGMRGGCVISSNSPTVICDDCQHSFYSSTEINEIYDKFSDSENELTDDYLLDEIILHPNPSVPKVIQLVAVSYLKEEKSLLKVRLTKESEYQRIAKKKLLQLQDKTND